MIKVTKTDFGTRVGSLLCIYTSMRLRSLWNCLMGGLKGLEMPARESLECCKLSLMGDSWQSSEDQNLVKMQTIKTRLRRFQLETKTPLAAGHKTSVLPSVTQALVSAETRSSLAVGHKTSVLHCGRKFIYVLFMF